MFWANVLYEEGLRCVPSVAFFQAAVRRYDTTCVLSVFPCVFLGCRLRVAPRRRPRVSDV